MPGPSYIYPTDKLIQDPRRPQQPPGTMTDLYGFRNDPAQPGWHTEHVPYATDNFLNTALDQYVASGQRSGGAALDPLLAGIVLMTALGASGVEKLGRKVLNKPRKTRMAKGNPPRGKGPHTP